MKRSRCGRCEFWQSVRHRFQVTAFTRPRASCWSRWRNTRRDLSPGARRRHSRPQAEWRAFQRRAQGAARRPVRSREGRSGFSNGGGAEICGASAAGAVDTSRAAGHVVRPPPVPGTGDAAYTGRSRRALHGCRRAGGQPRQKSSGGHWNSGIAVLRNNGLIETDGRRYRTAVLFRE
jgi:hypothetical protein